jgi:hypothetical protein
MIYIQTNNRMKRKNRSSREDNVNSDGEKWQQIRTAVGLSFMIIHKSHKFLPRTCQGDAALKPNGTP